MADWIIGYGSLMDRASRTKQAPKAMAAYPVKVRGIQVGWFHQFRKITQSLSPTFLGAKASPQQFCLGVIYTATQVDLIATDQRETGYKRTEIPVNVIELQTGNGVVLQGGDKYWIYISEEDYIGVPSTQFPLVQSYVDLCLNGAIEAMQTYPVSAGKFPGNWIDTIEWAPIRQGDQVAWLNDRTYPYRASLTIPNSSAIDSALADNLRTKDLWSVAMRQFSFK
jgi:hypothetical protein